MRAKTKQLLYQLLWTADHINYPPFLETGETFEEWAHRKGLDVQIRRLERDGYLHAEKTAFDEKTVIRLTKAGRAAALGGRDPNELWSDRWDEKWRMILFDIPVSHSGQRRNLTNILGQNGYGCLQGSVWISARIPDAIDKIRSKLNKLAARLLILDIPSQGRKTDICMVSSAWNFNSINAAYDEFISAARQARGVKADAKSLGRFACRCNEAWLNAIAIDPLLPSELHPRGYRGPAAWKIHQQVLKDLNRRMV